MTPTIHLITDRHRWSLKQFLNIFEILKDFFTRVIYLEQGMTKYSPHKTIIWIDIIVAKCQNGVYCAECCYVDCHHTECHCAECHHAECHQAKCHYDEYHNAECHHAECHHAHYRHCINKTIAEASWFETHKMLFIIIHYREMITPMDHLIMDRDRWSWKKLFCWMFMKF